MDIESDTSVDRVLVSENFVYWGCDGSLLDAMLLATPR